MAANPVVIERKDLQALAYPKLQKIEQIALNISVGSGGG